MKRTFIIITYSIFLLILSIGFPDWEAGCGGSDREYEKDPILNNASLPQGKERILVNNNNQKKSPCYGGTVDTEGTESQLFVNPNDPTASDSNLGIQNSPFKTLKKGLEMTFFNQVNNISTKLIICDGVYREGIEIGPAVDGKYLNQTEKKLIIEAATKNKVIISGSDTWTGWKEEYLTITKKRGNFILHSDEFDKSPWMSLSSGIIVKPNEVPSPYGKDEGDVLIPNNDGQSIERLFFQDVVTESDYKYKFSLYVKPNGLNRLRMSVIYEDYDTLLVDIVIGKKGEFCNSPVLKKSSNVEAAEIIEDKNGWYYAYLIPKYVNKKIIQIRIHPLDSSGELVYTGNGVDGLALWGAQLDKLNPKAIWQYNKKISYIQTTNKIKEFIETKRLKIFTHDWKFDWGVTKLPEYAIWDNDIAGRREMVIVDNSKYSQSTIISDLSTGRFLVDEDKDKIYIGVNNNQKASKSKIEISVRNKLLYLNGASNIEIRGLTFQHAASPFLSSAVTFVNGKELTLSDNIFRENNDRGVGIGATSDVTTSSNIYAFNGGSGLGLFDITNYYSQGDKAISNNQRGFVGGYVSYDVAGIKAGKINNATFDGLNVSNNLAGGLWFDSDIYNVKITESKVSQNKRYGIEFEAVSGPVEIAKDEIKGNGESAISAISSKDITIHDSEIGSGIDSNLHIQKNDSYNLQFGIENWTLKNNSFFASCFASLLRIDFTENNWDLFKNSLEADNNKYNNLNYSGDGFIINNLSYDFPSWQTLTNQDKNSNYSDISN